jgi:kynurenine formamidase
MGYPDAFHEVAKRINNWGRWGDDDEIGTINLVTDDVVREAACLVQTGRRISLALPLGDLDGIQMGLIRGRANPLRTMVSINTAVFGDPSQFCTSDDVVFMGLQAATHWDGLGHATYDGRMWNGHPISSIDEWGASKCGIHLIRSLTSRGVLLDVARAKGLDELEPGYPIQAADLDAAAELGKVEVRSGDIVLIRTGSGRHLRPPEHDIEGYTNGSGLTVGTAVWFHEHDVAAVATDNITFEVFPCEDPEAILPVHPLHLVEMGMTQGQNWMLEELADDCAADGRYTFFLEASPQPFTNALGSPVNPVAIK